jgi:membrane protein involved in colicin uptake
VFSDDGEPDAKKIAKAIDDFLAEEDNAGLRAGGSSRPSGDGDGGKGSGAPSGDMNEYIRSGIKRK